ncbi:MAG: hypothetical protein OXR68_04695 [Alphaproteobacteria bacterium]|nr:hypothetical protein [Alphaproteobacteria bacterium]MDD9919907.1 hypothetical protein [Alphaproteobacteria bacterium]
MSRTRKKESLPLFDAIPRYPDLTPAMQILADRQAEDISEDRAQLLEKWQTQLKKLQQEINRLEKLEKFSNNLTRKPTEDE